MEPLNLFEDWTPEMINSLKYQGKGCRSREVSERVSKTVSEIHVGRTLEEKGLISKKLSESNSRFHASRTVEEKEELSRKLSRQWRDVWAGKTLVEMVEINERKSRARREFCAGRTPEERRVFSEKVSKVQKELWAGLTPEEFEARLEGSLMSNKAIKNRMDARKVRPTMPELLLGMYLERNFPRGWKYNGGYSQEVAIGRKIPDFVSMDDKKLVIEVLGGIGYYHSLDEEGEKIAHYKRYGFDCLVVFEWDCYLSGELDRKFKEWYR